MDDMDGIVKVCFWIILGVCGFVSLMYLLINLVRLTQTVISDLKGVGWDIDNVKNKVYRRGLKSFLVLTSIVWVPPLAIYMYISLLLTLLIETLNGKLYE